MFNYLYKFSIFTPIFNRAKVIHRVWNSLINQTFKDFEWIVVDDGSTDDSLNIIEQYAQKASFPVNILIQSNSGKHIAWNQAVKNAKGELFVPADSDDSFIDITLERFNYYWNNISINDLDQYSGINVLCKDPYSDKIVGDYFPKEISNNLELAYIIKKRGEGWGCIRTDLLKLFPFPEIKGSYFPESYIWFQIARYYKVKCVNEALRYYYKDQDNHLNPVKKYFNKININYSFYAYIIWNFKSNLDYLKNDKIELIKTMINIWRMSFHLKVSFNNVYSNFNKKSVFVFLFLFYPFGYILFLYDKLIKII